MPTGHSLKEQLQKFSRTGVFHALGMQLLTATAVLMIAALILMSVTLSNLKESRQQTEAIQDTLLELTTVESRLLDSDGALSSLALGDNPLLQRRLNVTQTEMHAALDKLKNSLQGDALQLQRRQAIETLVRQRDVLNAYLRQHRDEIGRSPQAKSGAALTRAVRKQLWVILTHERETRSLRNAAMIDQANHSYWIAVGIVLLTFLFGALSLVLSTTPKTPA